MERSLFLIAALALCMHAQAAVIYKSIEQGGRITFSDVPLPGAIAVQRIAMPDGTTPAAAGMPSSLGAELDEAVVAANTRMDLAERSLAEARRVAAGPNPMALDASRASTDERARVDFTKREVLAARRSLMRALERRNSARP